MKILKTKAFANHNYLTTFVNDNSIAREDIIFIVSSGLHSTDLILFFYAEEKVKEKERNFWGNLKED